MSTRFYCIVITLTGLSLPVMVVADPTFTVSAGVSRSTADTLSPGGSASTLKSDFSGAGTRIAAGVRISDWIGFNAGWSKLGTNTGTVTFPPACVGTCPPIPPEPTVQTIKQDGSAYWLAYSPSVEYGQWSFNGSIGAARTEIRSVHVGKTLVQDSRESGMLIGAGAAYFFSEHFGVRFDAEKLGSEASQVAVSLTVRF